ncbi:MAG: hypothetical protein FWF51_00360 [Chitinivibrionia bacterium]|nr:hypothetical protein [Chitinivibrionia bacterium]
MEDEENLKLYRIVGYSVIILTVIGFLSMAGAFLYSRLYRIDVVHCEFPYIGDLKFDDNFTLNGNIVGIVKKITSNEPNRAIITINLRSPIKVREGYKLFIADVGIMGERMVCLENGPQDARLMGRRDTLQGIYYPGISDMLGRIMELRQFLDDCTAFVGDIMHGTQDSKSIIVWLNSLENSIDDLLKSVNSVLSNWDNDIPKLLTQVNDLSYNLDTDLTKFGEKVPDILEKTDILIKDCDVLLEKITEIQKLGVDVGKVVGEVNALNINALNSTMSDMQINILSISRDAHKLRLYLAREKKD